MAIRDVARWMTAPPAAQELAEPQTLNARHYAMLWGGLSMSLLAFLPGAYLVPALSLRDAVLVAVLGAVAGAAVLGAVAAVAAQRGKNTIGLLSSALGVPAGTLVASFLLLRHIAWATFALAFASSVATYVPGVGGPAQLWTVALAAIALALALLPPQTFVRKWMGWFAFWLGLILIALITLTGITTYGIPVLHDADGLGGWPSRGQGFDLVATMPLLWLPVVADYARDARSPRDAGIGAFAGAGSMTAWYAVIGLLWVFSVSTRDVAGFITALPVGAAGLLIIVALEADAAAANVYAASMAGGRFGYRWFRPALVAAGIVAGAIVVATDALGVEDFVQLLGGIFLPLFAVVLARHFVAGAPAACSWVAWALGILAYFWINPGDVGPWREAVEFLFADLLRAPFPLGGDTTALPATAVSFAVAFAAYALLASPWRLVRRAS